MAWRRAGRLPQRLLPSGLGCDALPRGGAEHPQFADYHLMHNPLFAAFRVLIAPDLYACRSPLFDPLVTG
jgi:hypothetical protein